MNPKITGRMVKEWYPHIFTAGYCSWQNIISVCNWEKVGHAEGTFGWNWDCFEITSGICLVTGYRSFPKATDRAGYEKMEEFEKEAGALRRQAFEKCYDAKRDEFRKRVVEYLGGLANFREERKCSTRTT